MSINTNQQARSDKLINLVKIKPNSNKNFLLNLNDIKCSLCEELVQSAVRCEYQSCNNLYCEECAERMKTKRKKCLNTNAVPSHNLTSFKLDYSLQEFISNNIIFTCKNKFQGCNYETSSLEEISYHLIDCNLLLKTCPNSPCVFKGTESELAAHLESCEFVIVKCAICEFRLSSKDERESHECLTKIVEEIAKIEDMIEKEREALEEYVSSRRKELLSSAQNLGIKLN